VQSLSFVVIGDSGVARQTCATLTEQGHAVHHLDRPDDNMLRTACTDRTAGIAVLVHDDVMALRYALVEAHINDIAGQLTRLLPHCEAVSPADLAAPSLAGPCVNGDWLADRARRSVVSTAQMRGDGPAAITLAVEQRPLWRRPPCPSHRCGGIR